MKNGGGGEAERRLLDTKYVGAITVIVCDPVRRSLYCGGEEVSINKNQAAMRTTIVLG